MSSCPRCSSGTAIPCTRSPTTPTPVRGRRWGRLPQAQAIVVVSAHWLTPGATHITDAPKNPIIYDFGGFPDELYRVKYETFGDEQVAKILARQLVEYEAELDKQWGLDHGTWSVLKHLAPAPDVPVLQISIDYSMPLPGCTRSTDV
ncbi:dioxygenase [Aeromicrobium sp. UC242_57]|uniref:dioxygenase n=1 Tax=Aeromicrobium sp. UC242_57 TaxID=3374624 RepID=UPI0037A19A02